MVGSDGGGGDGLGGLFGEGEESQPFCAYGMPLLTHNDWDHIGGVPLTVGTQHQPSATSRSQASWLSRGNRDTGTSGDELPGALSYLGWSGCWMKLPVDVSGVRWASWGRYSSRNTRATSSWREDTSVFSNRLLMWSWTV